MNNNTEFYEFYNGAYNTCINRKTQNITMNERGGWSRDYHLTFQELLDYAKNWDIAVDLNEDDRTVAEVATKIILANNSVEHGLDPFRYIPRTNKITDPRDLVILQKFESFFSKYSSEQIMDKLSEETKGALKSALKDS